MLDVVINRKKYFEGCHWPLIRKTLHQLKIVEHEIVDGKANTFLVRLVNYNNFNSDFFWEPSKVTASCGALFFTLGKTFATTIYFWIFFFGSSDEARRYSCRYSVTSKIWEKFNFDGPIHTIDKEFMDIIDSGSLLMIGVNAAKRSISVDNKQLAMEITTKNLKGEAKDDDMAGAPWRIWAKQGP